MATQPYGNKRILVTGGAGFIGSHLIDRLLAQGHEVLCVDNLFTGTKRNLDHVRDHPRFEFMRHDVTFPLFVKVDEIYNLACPASPVHYQHDPVQTTKTSVSGAINTLELAKRLGAKVLQASTSEVYGDPHVHPQVEDYWGNVNPIGPRSCYDEGKRCAETLFFDFHRQYNLHIKVARIFNTYGPRMHPSDGRVVSNFAVQALAGDPITIYGEGQQTRSFCYVDDLVTGLIALMGTDETVTGPINLGNPIEVTVRDLAERIVGISGSQSQVIHHDLPTDDPKQRCPDVSAAKRLLDWEPTVSLKDGLKATVAYFKDLAKDLSSMITLDGIISDRGSKYAVSGGPCASEADAKQFIKILRQKKKFAKATHNTWGVITQEAGPIKNDDGESGAGMVILRMLEREGLINHIVVVTRWYGGKHLGGDRFRHVQDAVRMYFDQL